MEQFITEHIIPNIWGAIVAIVGAIWMWIRTKKKEGIENDGGIVDNAKKVLEMSEDIAERLEKQLESSDGIIAALKEKLRLAIESDNTCQKALKAIREEYSNFQILFNEQKVEIEALKEECKLLRLTIEANENGKHINDGLHLN